MDPNRIINNWENLFEIFNESEFRAGMNEFRKV